MPTSTFTASRTTVKKAITEGPAWLLNEGWEAVRDGYLPALQTLEANARTAPDRKLTAHAWYTLGTLWQLNDAPRAAIGAFERCLRHAPASIEARAEIARMHAALGQRRQALALMREAAALAPQHAEELEDMLFWEEARYPAGCAWLAAAEALTQGDSRRALKALSGRGSVDVRRWRACAHGARGDIDAVIDEWRAIARASAPVRLSYADWFYLPAQGWARAELWECLHRLGSRLDEEGVFPIDDSLRDARRWSEAEKGLLTFARRAAQLRGDRDALTALLRMRPRWPEAREGLAAR